MSCAHIDSGRGGQGVAWRSGVVGGERPQRPGLHGISDLATRAVYSVRAHRWMSESGQLKGFKEIFDFSSLCFFPCSHFQKSLKSVVLGSDITVK